MKFYPLFASLLLLSATPALAQDAGPTYVPLLSFEHDAIKEGVPEVGKNELGPCWEEKRFHRMWLYAEVEQGGKRYFLTNGTVHPFIDQGDGHYDQTQIEEDLQGGIGVRDATSCKFIGMEDNLYDPEPGQEIEGLTLEIRRLLVSDLRRRYEGWFGGIAGIKARFDAQRADIRDYSDHEPVRSVFKELFGPRKP